MTVVVPSSGKPGRTTALLAERRECHGAPMFQRRLLGVEAKVLLPFLGAVLVIFLFVVRASEMA